MHYCSRYANRAEEAARLREKCRTRSQKCRTFDTKDSSMNDLLVAILTFGEGCQTDHHAIPRSGTFSKRCYEIDLVYFTLLRRMARFGT